MKKVSKVLLVAVIFLLGAIAIKKICFAEEKVQLPDSHMQIEAVEFTEQPTETPTAEPTESPVVEVVTPEVTDEPEEQEPQIIEKVIKEEVDTAQLKADLESYVNNIVEEKLAAQEKALRAEMQQQIKQILKKKDYATKDELLELASMKDIEAVYEYIDEQDAALDAQLSDEIENIGEPAETMEEE